MNTISVKISVKKDKNKNGEPCYCVFVGNEEVAWGYDSPTKSLIAALTRVLEDNKELRSELSKVDTLKNELKNFLKG